LALDKRVVWTKRRLEPYDGKLSRTVLRGVRGSDAPRLPDLTRFVQSIHVILWDLVQLMRQSISTKKPPVQWFQECCKLG
ncbi:hypothetical protein, partial [Metabacillus rhizolycopersici]